MFFCVDVFETYITEQNNRSDNEKTSTENYRLGYMKRKILYWTHLSRAGILGLKL